MLNIRYFHFLSKSALLTICFLICLKFLVLAQQDCPAKLKDAQELYDKGTIENIPDMLELCIDSGFNNTDRVVAMKLVILSYLFDNNEDEADKSMKRFLHDYPEYVVSQDDPSEFVSLYKTYKTVPLYSVGAFIGTSITYVGVIAKNSTGNTNDLYSKYQPSGNGLLAGFRMNRLINDRITGSVELMFKRNSFERKDSLPAQQFLNFRETQTRLELPISLTYQYSVAGFCPYLRAGVAFGYLIHSTSEIVRKFTPGSNVQDITGKDINMLDYRKKLYSNFLFGAGFRYKVPYGFLECDIRYSMGLFSLVHTKDAVNDPLRWKYSYQDDKFRLNDLSFSIGYVYSFYRTTKTH
jgi:hypothetical protein